MTSKVVKKVKSYLGRTWTNARKNPGTTIFGVIVVLSGEFGKKILDKVYDRALEKIGRMAEPHLPDWLANLLGLRGPNVIDTERVKNLLYALVHIGWWIGLALAALVSLIGLVILISVLMTSSDEVESESPTS